MKLSITTCGLDRRFGYEESVRMIAKAGFDAYDMCMTKIHISDSPIASDSYKDYIAHLKAVADENGIVCNQAHAPFPTQLNGNGEYNEKTYDLIIRSIECASILGADVIVVHPIKNSSSSHVKEYTYEPFESKQQLYDENIKFFRNLIPYCEKFGIKIAVENMWERHPLHRETLLPTFLGYAEEHIKFIRDVNSSHIVGCLDIGHSLICGEKPHQAIHRLGKDHLKALHVHDNSGYEDLHTLPYLAKADWSEITKALADIEYTGDFTFEAEGFFERFPDDFIPEALSFMNKVGRYLINKI